jgi:hypothetical protein
MLGSLTLLEVVRKHCRSVGIPLPNSVTASNDKQVQQMLGLMDDFLLDLETRSMWQANVQTATFTSVAAELQGSLETLCPNGFLGIVPRTMYNRTEQREVRGGNTAQEWQNRKAMDVTGPFPEFRVVGDELRFFPAPPAGQTIAFEYYSNFFVYLGATTPGGPTHAKEWTNDADRSAVGDMLPRLWLTYAWRRAKGFDYDDEFLAYERAMSTSFARQNHGKVVHLDCPNPERRPGLIVPEGAWDL